MLAILTGVAASFNSTQIRFARSTREVSAAMSVAEGELERMYANWRVAMSDPSIDTAEETDDLVASIAGDVASEDVADTWNDGYGSALILGGSSHKLYAVTLMGDALDSVVSGSHKAIVPSNMKSNPGATDVYTMYDAVVTAQKSTLSGTISVTVGRTFTVVETSIPQFAIYSESDLFLAPGDNMTINGPVHTNGRLQLAPVNRAAVYDDATGALETAAQTATLDFRSYVSYNKDSGYAETANAVGDGRDVRWDSVDKSQTDLYDAKKDKLLNGGDRLEPGSEDMRAAFNTSDDNPNNDGFREFIERPTSGYTDPLAKQRFYNQASLKVLITQSGSSTTVSVLNSANQAVSSDLYNAVVAAIGTRKDMYDIREGSDIKITPVDVGALSAAIDIMNSKADVADHFNGILYVTDDSADGAKRAVRLENAATLPTASAEVNSPSNVRGFSVISDLGVYVKGDYNSTSPNGTHVPSAIMSDMVTVLSNNWDDANTKALNQETGEYEPTSRQSRVASDTIVRAAIVAGNIYDNQFNAAGHLTRSNGGMHNFVRLLEDWSNVDGAGKRRLQFQGSIVQLFTSTMFNGSGMLAEANTWTTGKYYAPGERLFAYDDGFLKRPAPGAGSGGLASTVFARGPWRRLN